MTIINEAKRKQFGDELQWKLCVEHSGDKKLYDVM